jgi:hypothetical protein
MDTDMAGVEHPGEKNCEGDSYNCKKRSPPRSSAILPDPAREKREKMVDQTQKVDKHREKDEVKQNARIKGSQGADCLLENRRLSPLQAVPQEKSIGKWEIENEYDNPE